MVSRIQNILTKNLETICRVILAKTSQKMIVNLFDDGFDRFTDQVVNITSVVMLLCMTSLFCFCFFFSPVD